MPVSSSTEHWIKPDALNINLNHFGDPDYLQVSVLAGAVVMAFKQDVIGYNAAHNYRTWPLEAANTYLETSSAYNVYARLTRSEVNARALIVYDTVLRDIEGREISYADDGSEILSDASAEYFFVFLGQISESIDGRGKSVSREWTVEFKFGNLDTNQYQNEEAGGEWTKMFRLNKVTDMIDVLKTFSSAIFKKLFIDKKAVTDVAVKSEVDEESKVNDTIIASTAWVKATVEDRYLRKDMDDRSVGYIASDKGFEAGKFVQEATGASCYQDKDGNWHIETDHLRVRKKATFTEIEVQEVHHVGGQVLLTAADMIVEFVLEMEDRYRCYFRKVDSDGREIENLWQAGDQAYCNTFNLTKQADGTLGNHYLWRLVIGTNLDTKYDVDTLTFGDITINTAEYNFTDLSKEVCAVDSDTPIAKDEIVSLGYQYDDDPDRQNALILAGAGAGSPYIYEFTGINSFHLPEPETRIKPGDNLFSGIMRIKGGSTGASNLEDFPDEVFKAVQIGSVNLLLNSGFTGDYKAEELNASYALNNDSELFSRGMNHWTGTATINDDETTVSGKCAVIGSLSQSVQLMKDENYVVSFKAKGASVKIMLGGESIEKVLSAEYESYSFKFVSDGIGMFSISGDATICDLQLERGTIATDWHASPYDNDKTLAEFQALKYIQDAIREGDTTILGGLILSSMIQLGNYKDGAMKKVNAGMSGIYNDDDDVAFWGGGTFEQAIATVMKFKQNPNYRPTDAEWKDLAKFAMSHGGDLFLKGTIFADSGYFRGSIYANGGSIGGFTITESDIHAQGSEISAINQKMYLYKDGLKFSFTGGTNGETFFGARGMSLSQDSHFVHSIFIKNNAILQWPMCGVRMSLQPTDLGLFIEGGSTHILSSGQTIINGLTLNQVTVESDMTLPMNADSVVFNNTEDITVTLPRSRVGKVLYMKRINEGKVTLSGNIRPQNSRDVILGHSYEVGDSSIMLILQGLGWTIFYCG